MNNTDPGQVLSRLPDDQFFDRAVELNRVCSLATAQAASRFAQTPGESQEQAARHKATSVLVLGPPRSGKTELLRKCFDRLFSEGAETVPIFFALRPLADDVERFARDYLSQFLAQFIAFRRNDPRLISIADEPLAAVARVAPPEDYLWVRSLVDGFVRAQASGDRSLLVRSALAAPATAAARTGLAPFVIIDNFHLFADALYRKQEGTADNPDARRQDFSLRELRSEFLRIVASHDSPARAGSPTSVTPVYALSGLRRLMVEIIPPDEELFDRLEPVRIEPLDEEAIEQMIRSTAAGRGVDMSDSTTELMIQQLNRDLFYTRAMLHAAASRGRGLRTFMEFERLYTEEVLDGRISHYLGALLRDVAPESRSRRAVLEALGLVVEATAAVPIEAAIERMSEYTARPEELLHRLHARELVEISYGFVNGSGDPVLADYVRAVYRTEVAGARRPVAGEQLLGEKLKESYRLMMSRYNRAVEAQLVELLSRFDFQAIPSVLLDSEAFERSYKGVSRVQVRRSLEEEHERVRLPQIVLVNDLGANEQAGISWRLFAASGFEGGIYSEANEVLWLIAMVNSKEPLDLETLGKINQRLDAAMRGTRASQPSRLVRWYISKEGFSALTAEKLTALGAYRSTYPQLDLLYDHLIKLAAETEPRPASEFELVIPIEDDAELIAARTVEQIARAADFNPEAINQIKTALIEACLNAAEHSDSPDRRIYQKFAIEDDRLVITVMNKGKAFGATGAEPAQQTQGGPLKGTRGRGLQIIRALMDEVRFERADDGARLVMTKFFKRPES